MNCPKCHEPFVVTYRRLKRGDRYEHQCQGCWHTWWAPNPEIDKILADDKGSG